MCSPRPQRVTLCYTILLNSATPEMFLGCFEATGATSFWVHERVGHDKFFGPQGKFSTELSTGQRVCFRVHHATPPARCFGRDTPEMHEFFDVRIYVHFSAFRCKMNALSRNVPYVRSFAKTGETCIYVQPHVTSKNYTTLEFFVTKRQCPRYL